jgi:hypothetical protein
MVSEMYKFDCKCWEKLHILTFISTKISYVPGESQKLGRNCLMAVSLIKCNLIFV